MANFDIDHVLAFAFDAPSSKASFAKHEAVLKLCTWMRYPAVKDSEVWKSAFFACASKYLVDKLGDNLISETAEFSIIARNMRITDIASIFSGEKFDIPDFNDYNYFESALDEFSYSADIAKFMISYDYDVFCKKMNILFDKRRRASLNAAFQFISWRGFNDRSGLPRRYVRSWSNFSFFWQTYGPSCAFHYVDEEYFGREFNLNPQHSDFVERVDEITSNYDQFLSFLSRSKAVVDELGGRLHPRALAKVKLPVFPAHVQAVPFDKFHFSNEIYEEMSGLNMADRDRSDD
jgi:hypothetical protein